jgi:DMSO/TMAO reductase YedYZ molybdopterin-dependent catalytic subunit
MAQDRKVVTSEPENSETPLERVHSWVTPTRWFFVRNHFEVPTLDAESWRLSVTGCVNRSMEWTYEQLTALPERSVFATVECAGNGRSFLQPRAAGVPWGAGAVGHAEWTGVPLARLLEQAGIQTQTTEIVFTGADRGTEPDHPGPLSFQRSLPLAKALDPDTLLTTRMNGEPLEPAHGFPVRLLVPGWYGVASVKWLTRIEALQRPFEGYFQTNKYTTRRALSDGLASVPIREMNVKAEILRPASDAVLGVGMNRLMGIAWAGEEAVARVEVSTDGGATWCEAERIGPSARYSWTLWEYLWEAGRHGRHALLVRAVSASGNVQPAEHDPLNGGYLIHHSRPTWVEVAPSMISNDHLRDPDVLLYDMNAYAEEITRFPLDVEMEYALGEGI